jgi:hypothetical protein
MELPTFALFVDLKSVRYGSPRSPFRQATPLWHSRKMLPIPRGTIPSKYHLGPSWPRGVGEHVRVLRSRPGPTPRVSSLLCSLQHLH